MHPGPAISRLTPWIEAANEGNVRGNRIFSFLKLSVLFAMLFLLTGCEALIDSLLENDDSSGGSRSRGVSLSQAMESSASGSREPLHGSGSRETYSSVDTSADVAVATGSSNDTAAPISAERSFALQIPMDVAYSVPFNGEIESLTRFTLTPICMENERNSFGLFVSGDLVEFQSGSLPDRAAKNAWMFELGMAYRRYFNSPHAFISPYLAVNAAVQALYWDYRNPVYVDGDQIDSDSLDGFGGYAGLGVAFKRNSHLNFFAEAGVGGTTFVGETVEGFHNDVFSDFGYFSVKAGLCIKF
jgi:hypothetical protein